MKISDEVQYKLAKGLLEGDVRIVASLRYKDLANHELYEDHLIHNGLELQFGNLTMSKMEKQGVEYMYGIINPDKSRWLSINPGPLYNSGSVLYKMLNKIRESIESYGYNLCKYSIYMVDTDEEVLDIDSIGLSNLINH